jgi:hypothetical protein
MPTSAILCVRGYRLRDLTHQLKKVRDACDERSPFFSQPRTLEVSNIRNYLTANWDAMSDRRSRCAVPWIAAEISARGDVTPCHTFYDRSATSMSRAARDLAQGSVETLQTHLRVDCSICTACCRITAKERAGASNESEQIRTDTPSQAMERNSGQPSAAFSHRSAGPLRSSLSQRTGCPPLLVSSESGLSNG